ncbi:MAG: hypothetical protein NE334_05200, partial [Lentisphaeraceae bacterium]|nr:hypothetical protein [Lentisphaeraceae bacterium]
MSEEEKFERRTFLKNLFSVIFRRIISSVISFFSIILIARNFGVKANGEYAISLLVSSMFVTFFNLGLSPANVYFIASKKLSI